MRDFAELLDATDLAVERSRGVVSDSVVADASARMRELRRRHRFVTDV